MRARNDLEVLLNAAIEGDERAYAEFLRRSAGLVRNFAKRAIGNGALDPEDIVQEALLAIHLKRHTWKRDSAVPPWLYAIAHHKLIDALRRRGSRLEVPIEEFSETLAGQEAEAVSEHDMSRVLASLSAGQRAVVTALSVEGRSISETASQMKITETAVRVAFHRGLAAIKRRFGH